MHRTFSDSCLLAVMHTIAFPTLLVIFLSLLGIPCYAEPLRFAVTPEAPGPAPEYREVLKNAESKVLKTIVQYERRLDGPKKQDVWLAFTKLLERTTALDIELDFPESQLAFERGLANGSYDFAYMTPLQFIASTESQNYRALVKRKAQPLRSLILVKKEDEARTLRDIENDVTGFSSLLNYTSSIIPRHSLRRLGIELPMSVFSTEEALFQALTANKVRAISVAEASYYDLPPDRQEQHKILWETPGFAPFVFAAHPRLPFFSINKLQRAMVNLNRGGKNQELFALLRANNGFEVARNSDWIDAQSIDLRSLNLNVNLKTPPDRNKGL